MATTMQSVWLFLAVLLIEVDCRSMYDSLCTHSLDEMQYGVDRVDMDAGVWCMG